MHFFSKKIFSPSCWRYLIWPVTRSHPFILGKAVFSSLNAIRTSLKHCRRGNIALSVTPCSPHAAAGLVPLPGQHLPPYLGLCMPWCQSSRKRAKVSTLSCSTQNQLPPDPSAYAHPREPPPFCPPTQLPAAPHDCLEPAHSGSTIPFPQNNPSFTQIVFFIANWSRTGYPHRFLETQLFFFHPQRKLCSCAVLGCFWHKRLRGPESKPSSHCTSQHFQKQTPNMASVFILFSLSQIYNLLYVIHLKFKIK